VHARRGTDITSPSGLLNDLSHSRVRHPRDG